MKKFIEAVKVIISFVVYLATAVSGVAVGLKLMDVTYKLLGKLFGKFEK